MSRIDMVAAVVLGNAITLYAAFLGYLLGLWFG